MAHHARIEEVSDSEPEDMDPSDFDPQAFARSMMGPAGVGGPAGPSGFDPQLQPQSPFAGANSNPNAAAQRAAQAEMQEKSKSWQCIYPVYFDASRTHAEGRRVSKELAVPNPLARELVDAVAALGLTQVVFEPGKTHPKDWSNPGRVRVLIKKEGGVPVHPNVKNKHHLYNLVAAYLKEHPTTEDSPMRLRIAGVPPPKELKPPAVPRGWKINPIVPLHSPALSGGGVSENMFKDMMAEMQGEMPGSGNASDSAAGGKKNKKDKKKGKA
ncbi:signal recognition particle protein [Diplodia corticola]|uniref:Signal recognition particle protein n=1 Tax=Diplodia corticola TaxID=236234 RepID=A0A1J9RPS6_9PEZI|nr:signal recognition particle protein [Diplodia corticola]OJD34571.1 signal recognition particle protein [Diplodia corticola]